MSRKSARLQCKRKRDPLEAEEQEIIATFSKKRKAEEELERTDEVDKRRQQFQIKNQWVPISEHSSITTCIIVPSDVCPASTQLQTPSPSIQNNNNTTPKDCLVEKQANTYKFQNFFTTPISLRNSPLPSLQWADSREVWELMLKKEELYVRDPQMLDRHPSLQPRMRAILLDWLVEVCEVYRLHRETYYLAADFIDRYLLFTRDIKKQALQLIGISALFIAAKLEEIYPPKLTDFAYVTDGACTESEILEQELVMLKVLNWDLSPLTPNSWLNVFLQLVNVDNRDEKQHNFVFPQYSSHAFIQIARLIDLCSFDIGSLQFCYSIIATSAVYHMSSQHVALTVSGYKWADIAACVEWMAPFTMTLREIGPVELKFFKEIPPDTTHNIQTHAVDLTLLERAQNRQLQLATSNRSSPDITREYPGLITPPQSGKSKNKAPDSEEKDLEAQQSVS